MSRSRLWPLGLAALSLAALPFAARAQAPARTSPVAPSAVAGWDELVEALRTLPDRMLARLPEGMRGDPQVQQEVARLALEALASSSIAALGSDGDYPQFLPAIGHLLNIGQPNADTIYRSAAITPGGTYRITGMRGTLPLAVIAQVVPQGQPGANTRRHLDLATLEVDENDRFSVLVAPTRPKGHDGDFWELDPKVSQLMVRMVSADWA
ncbi:MAG: hypothetical protein WCY11_11230, partial [Novosphingobium sp.]